MTKYAYKVVWDMETLEVVERVPSDYVGTCDMAKASADETSIAASDREFFGNLQADYRTQFGNQAGILKSLTSAFQPILAGGINQQGFSPSELATYRTNAINTTGAEYQKAVQAVGGQLAGRGDESGLQSGVDKQIRGSIAASAAGKESSELLGIDAANYTRGRENFLAASGALGSAAGLYDPRGYAGVAEQAGQNAFSEASTIAQQNDTFGQVAGILGGAASSWLGGGGGNPFAGHK